jgi:hypothetical protein
LLRRTVHGQIVNRATPRSACISVQLLTWSPGVSLVGACMLFQNNITHNKQCQTGCDICC